MENESISTNGLDNSSVIANTISGETKLWAGKYKTPEEMEEALIGKDKEYGKLYNEHGEIKKKYEEISAIPETYTAPADVTLREAELAEIRAIAKSSGLTQAQFEKTAREMQQRIQTNIEALDNRKKEIGQENLNVLTDYVKKYYPESLQQAVLNQIIKDKNAMSDALKDRESRLNSAVPGMDRASSGSGSQQRDGDRELKEAHDAYHKNPNSRNRQKYIDLAREVGEER